ncbi:thioredoxin family protein, partial [Gammaproteobacteria bacterium]|nr:thioredoxin family protein [Gammaproteobacteria bacterium]
IPLPLPYNGIVYEKSSIEDFISSAVKADKQPVLIFGGNWCPDCRILSGSLKMPTIKKYMSRNYDVMHIDVGRYEINMDLLEMFGIEKEKGVPRVLVFDKKKNLINSSTTKEWTTVRDRKQQEIFNYFQDLTL